MANDSCEHCYATLVANQKFCGKCGKMQTPKEVKGVSKDRVVEFTSNSSTCPKCKQIDSVQKISSVIDGGTTTTSGAALSTPLLTQHPLKDSSVTHFSSQSQSVLVGRFQVPGIPQASIFFHIFIWWLICSIPAALFNLHANSSPGSGAVVNALGGAFIGAFPGALIGFISRSIATSKMGIERTAWSKNFQKFRNSYYCSRDDLAFNLEFNGSPEQFVHKVFAEK